MSPIDILHFRILTFLKRVNTDRRNVCIGKESLHPIPVMARELECHATVRTYLAGHGNHIDPESSALEYLFALYHVMYRLKYRCASLSCL